MAELSYWIAFECTGVPNEVAGLCIFYYKFWGHYTDII